jgi:hypothetical protein
LGAKNRYTYATKEILSSIVNDELDHLRRSIRTMTDVERAGVLVKLIPYVVSRDVSVDAGDTVHVITLGR